jgi:hypothetical protein
MEEWLPTREAMAYVGVKRPESLPMWTDRPPANPRRLSEPTRKYTPVRVERRGGRKFYYRPDLDAYMAFQSRLAERMVVLRLHKPIRICAECEKPWPCEDYRKAHRR